MKWLNEPTGWSHDHGIIRITSDPNTDFWRLTHCGEIHDNGHFYYKRVNGDFTAEVRLDGDYHDLYDQSGLMLRIDERCWLKCGVEYMEGTWHVSAVVTRDWSDWSMIALPGTEPVSIRIDRTGAACEIYYATGGSSFAMYRHAFLTDASGLDVGLMSASPTGKGFTAVFDRFAVSGVR